jgi:5-methylcytosine-specific restriction protein A
MTTTIGELPDPVVAAKVDWGVATKCLSFSPDNGSLPAMNSCQNNVYRQFRGGYVLESISKTMPRANPGFETEYARRREEHKHNAGKLIAVHRLEHSWRPLWNAIGRDEYERIQAMWAPPDRQHRWAVAFPFVESWDIVGRPYAEEVFGKVLFKQVHTRSRELRILSDAHRACLADLAIVQREIEQDEGELTDAERRIYEHWFDEDFAVVEGMPAERMQRYRQRFPGLAREYKELLAAKGMLRCDLNQCNPQDDPRLRGLAIDPLSLFDVHHKRPLQEGPRETRWENLSLLCPSCHRITHAILAARR